jgi:GAF domain-containing protein
MSKGLNIRVLDMLSALAETLVVELDADACAISRVIGDVLILVAEHVPGGGTLQLGQGYLVSEFPQTENVLANGVPRALTIDDPQVDDGEAGVLRELGYRALLMLRLELNGTTWGLVEVYRLDTRPFDADDVSRASELTRLA